MDPRLGCLILHGLSSSLDTVKELGPVMEQAGIPYRMPLMRGHGTTPEALQSVLSYRDWYADALEELRDLLDEVRRAVVVGLSMGGLVALNIAMDHKLGSGHGRVVGVSTIACALRLRDPRVRLAPLVARFQPWQTINVTNAYSDPELAKASTNYTRVPSSAILTLLDYQRAIEQRLPEVTVPALIVAARNDRVVDPRSNQIVYDRIGTPAAQKEIHWFDRSGHEMLQDVERKAVADLIGRWVVAQRELLPEGLAATPPMPSAPSR